MSVNIFPDCDQEEIPDISMGNERAKVMFDALGIDLWVQYPRSIDPTELLQAIDKAEPPQSKPTFGLEISPGVQLISCGEEPGYFSERFSQLREIALFAQQKGCQVLIA